MVTLAGKGGWCGKLSPVTTGLSHENHPGCKCDSGVCTLPKITMAQEDSGWAWETQSRRSLTQSTKPGTAQGGVPPWGPLCPAPSWPLPRHRGECQPLDKNQVEKMSLGCRLLGKQAAIMSQPWLGCGYFAKHILPVVMGTVGTN